MLAVVCLITVSLPAQDSQSQPNIAIAPTIPQTIEKLKQQILLGTSSQSGTIGPGIVAFDVSNLGTNINYHDGPVMERTHNVYFIWYGNWSGHPALTILPQFIRDLSASSYMNIHNTYFDNSRRVTNNVTMGAQAFDSYSQGLSLSTSAVSAVVSRALSNGSLPIDANGIYYVLTSADVNQFNGTKSFCADYCGWHSNGSISGADIKFSFVGNLDRCGFGCEPQSPSPNGSVAADSMANTMAHELSETLTDPDVGSGWFRGAITDNEEDGDLCNFTYGPTFTTSNGSLADITLNGRNYLIQQLYINSGTGGCAMAYRPITGLCYSAYVSNIGFLAQVCDGDVGGTVHQNRDMEGIKITAPAGYSVCYQVYASGIGWMSTQCNGAFAGTMHQSRQIEAMKVWFQSGVGHVEYFSQLSNLFWTGPSRDGQMTGTTGQSRAMEAVVIRAFQ